MMFASGHSTDLSPRCMQLSIRRLRRSAMITLLKQAPRWAWVVWDLWSGTPTWTSGECDHFSAHIVLVVKRQPSRPRILSMSLTTGALQDVRWGSDEISFQMGEGRLTSSGLIYLSMNHFTSRPTNHLITWPAGVEHSVQCFREHNSRANRWARLHC